MQELLYTAQQTRELDARAINEEGLPGYELMCRAGRAVFDEITRRYPACRTLTVVCGKGNNAGDGYVIARLAAEVGMLVDVQQLGSANALTGDAATARDDAQAAGVAPREHDADSPAFDGFGDVIVDALLGTGATGELRPAYASAVEAINTADRPVVAVDLPTGVVADTGATLGDAVNADVTVSFIGRKRGLATAAGMEHAGECVFTDLGVPTRVYRGQPAVPRRRFDAAALPRRRAGAYKQSYGHVLIVGGDDQMGGAVMMAAEAALRSGAGLVTVATRPRHQPAILARTPEVMVVDALSPQLDDVLARASLVGLGPGLGRGAWGGEAVVRVLELGLRTVVDADGLHWLARNLREKGRATPGPLIVTPHPGEAAALMDMSVPDIQQDRFVAATGIAERYRAAVILKGAGSIAADPDGRLAVCGHGNPGMASAGMGDVLTGIVCGIWAQGLSPFEAAECAMLLHSAAGDRAAARTGQASLIATDLIAELGPLLDGR